MSQDITIELQFFMISIIWGILILLAYDQIRVLRRILPHKISLITIQDLLFWLVVSVFVFAMIYVQNSGTIRGFSIMGIVIGMVIYHYILSDLLVKIESRLILLILRPFSLAISYICKGIRFLINKVKKTSLRIYGRLKNKLKSVKISLDRRREKKKAQKSTKMNERWHNEKEK